MEMRLIVVTVISIVVLAAIGLSVNEYPLVAAEGDSPYADGHTASGAGVVSLKSQNSFAITWIKLNYAIESNTALKIVAIIDHRENAKKSDLALRPTRLVIFGNPQLGTPLMQASQTAALDLPQKMLVFENEKGDVFVA